MFDEDKDILIGYHNTKHSTIRKHITYSQYIDYKPYGLWFAPNDEWLEFCTGRYPNWIYNNNFRLKINRANILIIDNVNDLIKFNLLYGILNNYNRNSINWEFVAKKYDGIFINNYNDLINHKEINKTNYRWLFDWDINSGCVWRLKSIQSVEKMKTVKKLESLSL